MSPSSMFGSSAKLPVVNVASVPQRSPFRSPGGKTWLVPHFRRWLRSLINRPRKLIEAFAGGGIISLTAAFENTVDSVLMVEIDDDVAAGWQTILRRDNKALAEKIIAFQMTPCNVAEQS